MYAFEQKDKIALPIISSILKATNHISCLMLYYDILIRYLIGVNMCNIYFVLISDTYYVHNIYTICFDTVSVST